MLSPETEDALVILVFWSFVVWISAAVASISIKILEFLVKCKVLNIKCLESKH